MEIYLLSAGAVCMALFSVIGIFDGVYYHLYRFQLYAHRESRREHLTHTVRVGLYVTILYALFLNDARGPLLWLGAAAIAVDVLVLLWDLLEEGDSRRNLGGLPHREYMIHVVANALHFLAVGLVLFARPAGSWAWNAGDLGVRPGFELVYWTGQFFLGGAIFLFLAHLALMHTKVQRAFARLLPGGAAAERA